MTTKSAFSPEEWKVVLEGPPSAGLIVITAARGGTVRETYAMSKAYVEARAQHGESELLDEIVAEKPRMEHGGKVHNPEELRGTSDPGHHDGAGHGRFLNRRRHPLASQARHSAFTSAICRGVAQEACTSRGLATTIAIARARDVATFSRRGS